MTDETIQEVLNELAKFYYAHSQKILTKSNPFLLSSLNYYNSILTSASRAIINNSKECECNIHPAFLIDKMNFNCQEDQFIKINNLKKILRGYEKEYENIDDSTTNLINFLNETDKKSIRFDDYYSFFISKENYRLTLSNILTKNDDTKRKGGCSWYCIAGCGSSHGCCGNYSGCCLYRHAACYVHDRLCTDCNGNWAGINWCFSGCIPDYQVPIDDDVKEEIELQE